MPGDAFPPRPCCARAVVSLGADHAADCGHAPPDPVEMAGRAESLRADLERRLDDDVHAETVRALREGAGEPAPVPAQAFARRLAEAADMVPGPPPGVEGSFLGGVRVMDPQTQRERVPRWAVHRFPTAWDLPPAAPRPDESGAVSGRAVIPLGARVLEVAHDTRTGRGLMLTVLADSEPGDDGFAAPRVGAWQALALRHVMFPGVWASPEPSYGPPELLAVVEGCPVFCVGARTLTPLDDVDGIRRAAGHDL